MNIEKLKKHLKNMQYGFNESIEASQKRRNDMLKEISNFKKYLKKGVRNDS